MKCRIYIVNCMFGSVSFWLHRWSPMVLAHSTAQRNDPGSSRQWCRWEFKSRSLWLPRISKIFLIMASNTDKINLVARRSVFVCIHGWGGTVKYLDVYIYCMYKGLYDKETSAFGLTYRCKHYRYWVYNLTTMFEPRAVVHGLDGGYGWAEVEQQDNEILVALTFLKNFLVIN